MRDAKRFDHAVANETRRLRITGLVRVADRIRRELAGPASTPHRQRLERLRSVTLLQVERILRDYGAGPEALPSPSRRAYEFLRGLDLDAIAVADDVTPGRATSSVSNVSLVGLTTYLDSVLDLLARTTDPGEITETYVSIRGASSNVERHLRDNDLTGASLKAQSRSIRGWLAFFAERENFDLYVAAVRRAATLLDPRLAASSRFQAPAQVQFRPMAGWYRIRPVPDGTQIALPTPMISFSQEAFEALAEFALAPRASREKVMEATCMDAFQTIQAELEALSGVVEQTAGVYHDLALSFERVNQAYFGGGLVRPRLCWSRVFTGRKFGHYDAIRDTVMLSATLDRGDVPEFVVDFVVYHELLHKKLGVVWRNGRREAHTGEFRDQERRFARFDEAEKVIQKLALGENVRT